MPELRPNVVVVRTHFRDSAVPAPPRTLCRVAGCPTGVRFRNVFCVAHGGPAKPPNTRTRKCRALGCTTLACQFGFCHRHEQFITQPRCATPGCTRFAHRTHDLCLYHRREKVVRYDSEGRLISVTKVVEKKKGRVSIAKLRKQFATI